MATLTCDARQAARKDRYTTRSCKAQHAVALYDEFQYRFDFDCSMSSPMPAALCVPDSPPACWHSENGQPENEQADGQIREIEYSQEQPWLTQQRVLPLLRGYTGQPRWQLWLTPGKKPSRHWLQASGLSVERMILANHLPACQLIDAMISALKTGNYSLIISWIAHQLNPIQYQQIRLAAQQAHSAVILLRPSSSSDRPAPDSNISHYAGWYY